MVAEIVGGFVTFAIIVVLIIVFSIFFVLHYQDKHDSELFPTIIAIIGLIVVMSCLVLVPVDIFIFSSTMDPSTGERVEWADQETVNSLKKAIDVLYYVMYTVMLFHSFIVIPFAYFYYEEYEGDSTTGKRICSAIKLTIFTVIIMIVLLLLGFLLEPGDVDPTDPAWYRDIFSASNALRAICFIIACLSIIGIFVFSSYTAYGLTAFPISLMATTRKFTEEEMNVLDDLEITKEKKRTIQSKYLSGKPMSKRDKSELEDLEKKERLLSRRSNIIDYEKNSFWAKCQRCFKPLTIAVGVFFFLLTLLIFISVLLTTIDKIANSMCKSSCGFILENPAIFNPLDSLFLLSSRAFPLDYIIMIGVFLYFFFSTVFGIVQIGIKFCCLHLFTIRKKGTAPQGLLLMCVLLIFGLLFLNVMMTTIAPSYSAFGYQKYCNLTVEGNPTPCLDQPEYLVPCEVGSISNCTQTSFSTMITRISVLTPFFGIVFLCGNWLFLLALIIGFIYSLYLRRRRPIQLESDSEDED